MERRTFLAGLASVAPALGQRAYEIPADYLREPDEIPGFWVASASNVESYLKANVSRGAVRAIGKTAGGRSIRAVFYGNPRQGAGTTTFSGSLGFRDVRAYIGPDYEKKVYLAIAGVHGAEFEGTVGAINLLSVLETGKDLRGKAWPGITSAAKALDRVTILPIANVDGRARVPVRMIRHRGVDETVHEYFNVGARRDGTVIGWPQCKEHIPLDFSTVQFPGGYPNEAGVNIQHDDFFGSRQPETQALFDLAARERPDVTINMHTGAQFVHPLGTFLERSVVPAHDALYQRVITGLTEAGLEQTRDVAAESDLRRMSPSTFNLDSALNMHCGALAMLIESPAHDFSTAKRDGKPVFHTPDQLLDGQLICHQEAMRFLGETGGLWRWLARKK